MSFLVWEGGQSDRLASNSLIAVDDMYRCPYVAENGYRMDRWDHLAKSNIQEAYGFFKPKERLGMKMDALMPALVLGYIEYAEMPVEFRPDDPDEFRIEDGQ